MYTGDDISVVSATLHSCHDDIDKYLNFKVLYPPLCQAGILPPSSAHNFEQILRPDSTKAQINNLIIHLRRCTEQEFGEVIRILRDSAEEAGNSHRDLANDLETNFRKFKTEGCSGKHLLFSQCYVFRQPPSSNMAVCSLYFSPPNTSV